MKKTTLAQASYDLIYREVLAGFSYTATADQAAHLAYLITAVNRNRLNGSMGFITKSTHRGSGKSLGLAVGRVLAQGDDNAAMFQFNSTSDGATEQSLSRLLVAGGRFLHSDGSDRRSPQKSSVVTSVVTGVDGHDTARISGGSNYVPISGVVVTATLEPGAYLNADLARRFLTVNLDGPVTGVRKQNLIGHVMENRDELNAALRAIFDAGQNNGPAHSVMNLGFNHNWGERVLGALSHVETDGRQTFAQVIAGQQNAEFVNGRRKELFSDAV